MIYFQMEVELGGHQVCKKGRRVHSSIKKGYNKSVFIDRTLSLTLTKEYCCPVQCMQSPLCTSLTQTN